MFEVTGEELDPMDAAVYRRGLEALLAAEVPFLVGGAFAFASYTGIQRYTKDFDVFVRPDDAERALATLASAGGRVERTFPHWLGKVWYEREIYVDVIYSSGNGVARVDDGWFEHARSATVFGVAVRLCPPEEIVWSKAFVQERERYDGADVAHLLRAGGRDLDWGRLVARFGPHWRVLLSHLVLFGFVYPGERDVVPESVLGDLVGRLHAEGRTPAPVSRTCAGTLLSRLQYLHDLREWGYRDARESPLGSLDAEDLSRWTEAGEREAAEREG
jgi:hypothetical protein